MMVRLKLSTAVIIAALVFLLSSGSIVGRYHQVFAHSGHRGDHFHHGAGYSGHRYHNHPYHNHVHYDQRYYNHIYGASATNANGNNRDGRVGGNGGEGGAGPDTGDTMLGLRQPVGDLAGYTKPIVKEQPVPWFFCLLL